MQGKSVQEIIEYRERTLGEFITSLVDPKERGGGGTFQLELLIH